jgi:hypothetical protein
MRVASDGATAAGNTSQKTARAATRRGRALVPGTIDEVFRE